MGLFSNIYNTVAKFFRPQEEQAGEDASKSVATNRLKLVLMQDRTNLTPRILEQMRSELIDLLSRYVELDKELLELNFEQEDDQVALMLSIPVIRAKDEEEIEAAIKAHKEALKAESETSEEESEEVEDSENDEISDEAEVSSEESDEDSSEDIEEIADQEEGTEKPVSKKKKKDTVSTPEEMSASKTQEEESSELTEEVQG